MRLMDDNIFRRPGFWGVVAVTLVIVVASVAWHKSPKPAGPNGEFSRDRGVESAAAKNDTAASHQNEAGRVQSIEQSAKPAALTSEQRQRLLASLKNAPQAQRDEVNFSLTLGSAVPRDVPLADLPTEASDVLHGYTGDKYLLVRDQLVVVDPEVRRIVALIPAK